MRVIVYGVGAIGGSIAAALARAGTEVIGIARGAMLHAVQTNGLQLRAPELDFVQRFDCVAHPSQVTPRADDIVLLTMKSQHTTGALEDLREAGFTDQPIFCFQNGVVNERWALRRFPNVHGGMVWMPAGYVTPGQVVVYAAPRLGHFDLGLANGGHDAADTALAALLIGAGFAAVEHPDVMASKYGKLLFNLTNILFAAVGRIPEAQDIVAGLEQEATQVFQAAGISWQTHSLDDPRFTQNVQLTPVDGLGFKATSTAQSLMRDTGSVETDYLNGEIVLMGRLHGIKTPLNAAMMRLATRMVTERIAPASLTLADLDLP